MFVEGEGKKDQLISFLLINAHPCDCDFGLEYGWLWNKETTVEVEMGRCWDQSISKSGFEAKVWHGGKLALSLHIIGPKPVNYWALKVDFVPFWTESILREISFFVYFQKCQTIPFSLSMVGMRCSTSSIESEEYHRTYTTFIETHWLSEHNPGTKIRLGLWFAGWRFKFHIELGESCVVRWAEAAPCWCVFEQQLSPPTQRCCTQPLIWAFWCETYTLHKQKTCWPSSYHL